MWSGAPPNPFDDHFTISAPGYEHLEVQVVDMLGRPIFQAVLRESIEVNTRHWPAGTYFVSLQQDGRVISKRRLVTY